MTGFERAETVISDNILILMLLTILYVAFLPNWDVPMGTALHIFASAPLNSHDTQTL